MSWCVTFPPWSGSGGGSVANVPRPQFFSALFGLLPEAQAYFLEANFRPDIAGYASVGFFLVGVLGLQIISELLHRCLPSSIVNCEEHATVSRPHTADPEQGVTQTHEAHAHTHHEDDEHTPLLDRPAPLTRRITDVFTGRPRCDANGKCYGYSDHPCDQVCALERGRMSCENAACSCVAIKKGLATHNHRHPHSYSGSIPNGHAVREHHTPAHESEPDHPDHDGHHHVAKNKYLSIGVQTSIAIALHKFPEGFITYATNHVNPNLGFTVFLALFIHNIAEGFAMALPLFLAFNSRAKAVLWASVLGGLAQPIGAGIAWLSIRGTEYQMNNGGYGVLFSITGKNRVHIPQHFRVLINWFSWDHVLCRPAAVLAGGADTSRE